MVLVLLSNKRRNGLLNGAVLFDCDFCLKNDFFFGIRIFW